ncbi:MAG TPA: A24 family peptidase [Phycisphaerae bacterium]|nr:A24 family peptidase [Phycisphaerae bacterium]HNU45729.1 A24 family peptidase [Phycisphaerae bacterium]
MTLLVTLWWLGFLTAVGLCAGSFLNVIIYRVPRDQSLRDPLWSACPVCGHRIRWYDNLPVLSFLFLRGRCRDCRRPIASRYLVIELAMALIVLVLLDAFLIGRVRGGLGTTLFNLTERLAFDWPILAAHVILFGCLLSLAAIDLEHYWVDIRFTNYAVAAGFILHMCWTPSYPGQATAWFRPSPVLATAAVLALAGLTVTWLYLVFQTALALAVQPDDEADDLGAPPPGPADSEHPTPRPPRRGLAWLTAWVALALFLALVAVDGLGTKLPHAPRALLPLGLFFLLILQQSSIPREADEWIVTAIEEERGSARTMVIEELLWLLPAVALGAFGIWLAAGNTEVAARITDLWRQEFPIPAVAPLRHWAPLTGLATAAAGYVVAGALGWAVRIFFTLLFGREAFGTGDIHLMAAVGCVAGWPVAVLGFIVTCVLALAGWLATLPFKRTRAIPLGPWLALACLTVTVFYDRIVAWPLLSRTLDACRMLLRG